MTSKTNEARFEDLEKEMEEVKIGLRMLPLYKAELKLLWEIKKFREHLF